MRPARGGVEQGATECDAGHRRPHDRFAEGTGELERNGRAGRGAEPARGRREPERRAPRVRRRHLDDHRLGRRRPEHLADRHADDDPADERERGSPERQREEGQAHQAER
jgi:hypothetical protein